MQDQSKLNEQDKELVRIAAGHAKERYDEGFISMGGALRTKSGKIYTGINLKYHVRNLSTCDSLMAMHKALDDGEREFDTFVGIKYHPKDDSFTVENLCGKCRELFSAHAPIKAIIDNGGVLEIKTNEELLPFAFASRHPGV